MNNAWYLKNSGYELHIKVDSAKSTISPAQNYDIIISFFILEFRKSLRIVLFHLFFKKSSSSMSQYCFFNS